MARLKKRNRPRLASMEELQEYLKSNPETELPFNDIVWEKAVEYTKDKDRQFKELQTTEFDGTTKTKRIPNGVINPVSKYFQMMALPQYANPVNTDEEYTSFDGGMEDFEGYKPNEKKFLAERLADYYNNYEINTGSDKFIVKQIIIFELELNRLNAKLASGKDVYAQIDKVTKQYLSLNESLKTLKKQRGAMDDEGKNKFTLFVDELEREGEFKFTFNNIKDDIDKMLDNFEQSMARTFNEG